MTPGFPFGSTVLSTCVLHGEVFEHRFDHQSAACSPVVGRRGDRHEASFGRARCESSASSSRGRRDVAARTFSPRPPRRRRDLSCARASRRRSSSRRRCPPPMSPAPQHEHLLDPAGLHRRVVDAGVLLQRRRREEKIHEVTRDAGSRRVRRTRAGLDLLSTPRTLATRRS